MYIELNTNQQITKITKIDIVKFHRPYERFFETVWQSLYYARPQSSLERNDEVIQAPHSL